MPEIALQERTLSEHTWPQSQRLKGLLTFEGERWLSKSLSLTEAGSLVLLEQEVLPVVTGTTGPQKQSRFSI